MGNSSLPVLPVTENYWLQEITSYRDLVHVRVAQGHFVYRKFLDQSVVLIWQFPKLLPGNLTLSHLLPACNRFWTWLEK